MIEALSVIVQVATFKWLGRRVLLMAPLQHHFEMKAWSETRIMVRFDRRGDLLRVRVRPLLPLLLGIRVLIGREALEERRGLLGRMLREDVLARELVGAR